MKKTRATISVLCFIFLVAGSPFCGAQQKSFTLEQVLSDPFPSELVAAPTGGRVAWLQNARGVRNIWIAEPGDNGAELKSRQLTSYTDDDGVDVAQLSWTPDGKTVVYARGADFEMGRDNPNAGSFPSGVPQGIWAISISEAQPRYLGEGHAPAISPKGDQVAFVFKGQVWIVGIDAAEKAVPLIQMKGEANSLRWSPNGSQLAFVTGRSEHSFIAVYLFGDKSIHYLDPSVDQDREPVWSPDGKRMAFLRIAADSNAYVYDAKAHRTGQPWSIRVADVGTGKSHEAWKAEEGEGSVFREVTAENQVLWGAGNRLIFPWERDGWTHLYSVAASGGKAQLLTPGEFEAEHVYLTPDRKEVIFSSNQNDIDRRHLWKVGVAGEHPGAVTHGDGIEWSPVMTSERNRIVFLHSDARRPARAAVLSDSGEARDLAPQSMPADFPVDSLVVPQQVIITATDGMKIHCQLFLPPNSSSSARHPAVLFFHGGSVREMLLGWHYMDYYHNTYALNQYLASRGYVVMSVNYRSGIGYGMKFREALNYGSGGASEFNDVLGAGLYLRGRSDVDPNKIGLWGGSYGGYLTALGLARASDLFAAGVDIHGCYDWNDVIRNFSPNYDPQKQPEVARLAFASSPVASMKTWRSPVLLIQGDDDRNVLFTETIHLAEALRKQGVEFEQLVFPDEVHDFLLHSTVVKAYGATADFFHRRLAEGSKQ